MPIDQRLPGVNIEDGKLSQLSVEQGPLDVRLFNARADGITDDTSAVQAWINALVETKSVGFLPAGTILISQTLVIPQTTAVHLIGQQRSSFEPDTPYGWNTANGPTALIWVGANGGTMFSAARLHNLVVENCSIQGSKISHLHRGFDGETTAAGNVLTLGFPPISSLVNYAGGTLTIYGGTNAGTYTVASYTTTSVTITGTFGFTLTGQQWTLSPTAGNISRAGKLFHFTETVGWNNTALHFKRVSFFNYDIGVQCSTGAADTGTDNILFEDVAFTSDGRSDTDLSIGVKTMSVQNHPLFFKRIGLNGTNTQLLDVFHGGDIYMEQCAGTPYGRSVFVDFRGGGPFAGTISMRDITLESNNGYPIVLKLNPTDGPVWASLHNLAQGNSNGTNPINPSPGVLIVGANANLSIYDSIINQTDLARVTGSAATPACIRFNNCGLPINPELGIVLANAYSNYEFEDCKINITNGALITGSSRVGRLPSGLRWLFHEIGTGATSVTKDVTGQNDLYYDTGFHTNAHDSLLGQGVDIVGRGALADSPISRAFQKYTPPYTLSFWLKGVATVPTNSAVIALSDSTGGFANPPWLQVRLNTAGAQQNYVTLTYNTTSSTPYDCGVDLQTTPHFICVVVESGTSAKIYVDGVLAGTAAPASAYTLAGSGTSEYLNFGDHWFLPSTDAASCHLWDLRYLRKALTIDEMQLLRRDPRYVGVAAAQNYIDLVEVAALPPAANQFVYFTSSTTIATSNITVAGRALIDDVDAAAQRTTLGLVIGTNVQAYDADLAAIAGLTSAANALPYFTGSGTAAVTTLTAFGRSLIDDAAASDARTTLGLGTAAVVNTGTSGATIGLLSTANAWTTAQTFTGELIGGASGIVLRSGATVAFTLVKSSTTSGTYFEVQDSNANVFFRVSSSTGSVAFRNDLLDFMASGGNFYVSSSTGRIIVSHLGTLEFRAATNGTIDTKLSRVSAGMVTLNDADQTGNPGLAFQARSSTTNLQDRFRITTAAVSNVHAARQYSAALDVYNFKGACRVLSMSAPASGTQATLAFGGGTQFKQLLSATATLDFANIVANTVGTALTMTVTGAAVGDTVELGAPSALEAGLVGFGFVSATNTVSIRLFNGTGADINPASATWRATVITF